MAKPPYLFTKYCFFPESIYNQYSTITLFFKYFFEKNQTENAKRADLFIRPALFCVCGCALILASASFIVIVVKISSGGRRRHHHRCGSALFTVTVIIPSAASAIAL
jgi:hypothetical protein